MRVRKQKKAYLLRVVTYGGHLQGHYRVANKKILLRSSISVAGIYAACQSHDRKRYGLRVMSTVLL
jgi:hypothetical protein